MMLVGAVVPAGAGVIDDFSAGAGGWAATLQYGQVGACVASAGEGVVGTALRVDFGLEDPGLNHVLFAKDVNLDLSTADSVSFQVKGTGTAVSVFFFLYDSQGRFRNYGPHGSNYDFSTGYAAWHTCRVVLDRDRSVQGGDADLSDIRRVGFFLWNQGPATGTAWFDDLAFADAAASVTVRPGEITPNRDGVYDACELKAVCPPGGTVTLDVLDPEGRVIASPVPAATPGKGRVVVAWDPVQEGLGCPPGVYTVRARFRGATDAEARAELRVVKRDFWPYIDYKVEPFFPVGVWFEGNPGFNGCPQDPGQARAWYERAFADLAEHHFNAVAVPNCPERHWDPLLRAAEAHGIRVVLEVGDLVSLVSTPEAVSETEAEEVCRSVVKRLAPYPALLRYQIRDEPASDMIPNWMLVQRIMAALDPRRPVFSCFCSPDALYNLAWRVPLTEACFDIYPHRQGMEPPTLGGFRDALGAFTRAAAGKTPWVVLQAFAVTNSPGSWRYPTPEELRAVTSLALAEYAGGIFYFIYNHMPGYLDGLVASDGTPQPLYPAVCELAEELQKLSPVLRDIIRHGPTMVGGVGGGGPVSGDRAVAQRFCLRDKTEGLIVASAELGAAQTVRVLVPSAGPWRDVVSGEELSAPVTSLMLAVPLAPGQGRVFLGPKP
jgi:hypothetical protein